MKTLGVFFILLALAGFIGCGKSEPGIAVLPTVSAKTPEQPVSAPPSESGFLASGPLVVEDQVDVAAQRAGVVAKILQDTGQPVHKGDLLAELDDRQLVAEHDAAEAKLHSCEADLQDWEAETKVAEADLRRAEEMRKAGINTQEELDHARYKLVGSQFEIEKAKQNVSNAQANLRALDLEREKTRIEAPFDGVVARRYVRAGQQVAIGDRLFWVTAVRPLRIRFTLPEKFIGQISKGQELKVSSAEAPATQHAAQVVQVSPVVDPSSGTFEVVAQIVDAAPDLRPGMTANVSLAPAR
jgi:membrane fusion protein (multidrug efflux system)